MCIKMKKLYLLLFVSVILSACWVQKNIKITDSKNQTNNQVEQNQKDKKQINTWNINAQTWWVNQLPVWWPNTWNINTQTWWVNQLPVWWPYEKVLKKMKDVKTINDCDKLFTKKEDLLTCKREYIIKNADKLTVKVCDNINDKTEQSNCKQFFKSRSNSQQSNPSK